MMSLGPVSTSVAEGGRGASPLSRVTAGRPVRICQLEAPPEVATRLREAGLYENQVIRLVSAGASLICQVCNTRLALSRELASTIHVMPVVAASVQPLIP